MYFDYEYFCGANVVIELDGVQVTELSGISYSIQETKRPIYGYSSRFFDAVARGQVLVRGTLLIPFVHRDYLYELMQVGKSGDLLARPNPPQQSIPVDGSEELALALAALELDPVGNADAIKLLQTKYWDIAQRVGGSSSRGRLSGTFNPHDSDIGCNITITFGERGPDNEYGGQHKIMLSDVVILSRGTAIQISEDCIMEEYSFFARNLWSMAHVDPPVMIADMQGDPNAAKIGT